MDNEDLYERIPVAIRVVEVMPNEFWQVKPVIKDHPEDGLHHGNQTTGGQA